MGCYAVALLIGNSARDFQRSWSFRTCTWTGGFSPPGVLPQVGGWKVIFKHVCGGAGESLVAILERKGYHLRHLTFDGLILGGQNGFLKEIEPIHL